MSIPSQRSVRSATILAAAALLVLPAGAAAAPWAPGAGTETVAGDDWEVGLHAAYTTQDGSLLTVDFTYEVWSPWPVPYAGYEARLHALQVVATEQDGDSRLLRDPAVQFYLVGVYQFLTYRYVVFQVNLQAEGLVVQTNWAWEVYDGCHLNNVVGDLEDTGGVTSYQGGALTPVAVVDGPTGPIAINGAGHARKVGPGDDGFFECWEGNFPPVP